MFTIRLPKELNDRLSELAKCTHRTKTYYVTEAIKSHLKDMEDIYDCMNRIEQLKNNGIKCSLSELVRAEDNYWYEEAEKAKEEGYIGIEESTKILEKIKQECNE